MGIHMSVYIYLRISTDKQDIDTQMESIKDWLKRNNVSEYKIIKDEGISGSTPAEKRPGFSTLLSLLQENDVLIVSELTRLGRSLSDVIMTLNNLMKRGVRIVSIKEGLDSTQNELQFKVMSTLIALFADLEREFIRKRTIEGLQRAKAQGKRIGRPKALTEEDIPVLVKLYEKGMTQKEIARAMKVSPSTIARTLKKLREQGVIEERRVVKVNKKKLKEVIDNAR
ncbi:recombinase family protein [Thermococcus gammatolerans]|nr:recombinase family protein [Thermococcus gammatolerans]